MFYRAEFSKESLEATGGNFRRDFWTGKEGDISHPLATNLSAPTCGGGLGSIFGDLQASDIDALKANPNVAVFEDGYKWEDGAKSLKVSRIYPNL